MKKRFATKTALALSVCMLTLWVAMGTNATVAWFTDTTDSVRNTFVVGDMHLKVSYKNDLITQYAPVEEDTPIFHDRALYEPGYTQVVYLHIENPGTVDFDYKLAVDVLDYSENTNMLGRRFCLPPSLRFGVVFGADEPELDRQLADTLAVRELDDYTLNTYSQNDPVTVAAGEDRYAAIVLQMPTWVGNEANWAGPRTGEQGPRVKLGITAFAQQAGTGLI